MKIIIRKARRQDWLILAKLHHDFRRFHFKIIDKISKKFRIFETPFTSRKFNQIITNKNKLYIIAKVKQEIVGLAIASVAKKTYHGKSVWEGTINRIYVDNKYRGQGISTLLRKKVNSWFKTRKVSFMDICVYAHNKKAMSIYEDWGFKPFIVVMQK